jgi:phosphoribosylformimino-5-aminoimidazole carboxamide ribotide isomerase
MRIIPAIDILNGKCVRLSKGDYNHQTIYSEDPVEVAITMEAHGIQFLHVVDLDGARSRHVVNHKILQAITTRTNLKTDFGGGVKSDADVEMALDCGASQITVGSIAVTDPEVVLSWLKQYGTDKIILGADCKDKMIATHGWEKQSGLDVLAFIADYSDKGIEHVICTDIAKDGMLGGPSFQLYKDILDLVKINLIASGGIASLQDLQHLKAIGCAGAIIGKAIYENKISLKELSTLC